MSLSIDGIKLPHPAILAPMSGVTDLPFRQAIRRSGGGLVVTEMIASSAVLLNVRTEMRKLRIEALAEAPLSIQLAGWDPLVMAEAALICCDLGATFIDINMGCPAKKVTGKLSGSALMRDLNQAESIIASVVKAVNIPVTLKMRLGWDDYTINASALAKIAVDNGVKMLAVHGRTRCQMYKGKADWKRVKDVAEVVDVPVIVNGDIGSRKDVLEAMKSSRASGVMIGRAAQGRPWLLGQAGDLLNGLEPRKVPSIKRRHWLMRMHLEDMLSHYGKTAMRLARKHIAWHSYGLPGSAELRKIANNSNDSKVVFAAVDQFFSQLDPELVINQW